MTRATKRSIGEEGGFSLVELLVVMLILGLLAAIAIPAFFNQRGKARDAAAKTEVRTAHTAIEAYASTNGGSYLGADLADLAAVEPQLGASDSISIDALGASSFTITSRSETDNVFAIIRASNGSTSRLCGLNAYDGQGGTNGCPVSGDWGA